ncbi:MAG TPA: hypothetical protein VF406_10895 [Thermodesulfobacteriota bacterium]
MPYTGHTITIPAGLGGLVFDRNPDQVPITHLTEARNVVIDRGAWRKAPGAATFGSAITGAPAIRAILDWRPTSAVQKLLVYAGDGTVYKDDGAGDLDAVTLVSGLSTTARGQWVTAGAEAAGNARKAVLFTGADQPQVLAGDGATMAAVTEPAADWATDKPVGGVVHQGRLVAFAGHRIYLSSATDHEKFVTGGLQFAIFPGVGERVQAAVTFQGRLYLWKYPQGIFWLDDSDVNSANWAIRPLSFALGCAPSPKAVLPMANDVLFWSADGRLHLLSAVQETAGEGVGTSDLSGALALQQFLAETVALGALSQMDAVWYGAEQTACFALPRFGTSLNTVLLLLNFEGRARNEGVKPTWLDFARVEALALRKEADQVERPLFGDHQGVVRKLFQAARSVDGVGYVGQYATPDTDFGFADASLGPKRKNFDALEVVSLSTGAWTATVEVWIDGRRTQTLQFGQGSGGAVLGSTFVLGTAVLGAAGVAQRRRRLTGNGRRLRLVGANAAAGEDFWIAGHRVSFRVAGEEERAD